MSADANGVAVEETVQQPFICKTTNGWLVLPDIERFRTFKEAKQSVARYRRRLQSLDRRASAACEEIASGQIVRVECGWNIIGEVRPGHWTHIEGPFETREQARRSMQQATELREHIAEHAERAWREELQSRQH